MESSVKPSAPTAHRVRRTLSWLFFLVFVALLGFGIVVYAEATTQVSGLAMAVIGILGLAVLATSLRLSRGGNPRRAVYAGGPPRTTGGRGIYQHDQWFHHMWQEQARRNDEYHQQMIQQHNFHMQQQTWNHY